MRAERRKRRIETALLAAGGALLVGLTLLLLPLRWHAVGEIVSTHWATLLGFVAASAAIVAGVVLLELRRRQLRRWPLRALPWWFGALALVAVGVAGSAAMTLLWRQTEEVTEVAQRVQLRMDAARTAFAAAAAVGALFALLLAIRRQWDSERSHSHEEFDAAERRDTEQYTKAVELLGSSIAPVRLGALYALERLAQGSTKHRQTVTDVICAYLRMPYLPPEDVFVKQSDKGATSAGQVNLDDYRASREEREVRLTAQRILKRHLALSPSLHHAMPKVSRQEASQYWSNLHLELAGAVLVDLDLREACMADVNFSEAVFYGRTCLDGVTIHGAAAFDEAIFKDAASFAHSYFGVNAGFLGARFRGYAGFDEVTFTKDAIFADVSVLATANFFGTTFAEEANFGVAHFGGDAIFDKCVFEGFTTFLDAEFKATARFDGVRFAFDPQLSGVSFANLVARSSIARKTDEKERLFARRGR